MNGPPNGCADAFEHEADAFEHEADAFEHEADAFEHEADAFEHEKVGVPRPRASLSTLDLAAVRRRLPGRCRSCKDRPSAGQDGYRAVHQLIGRIAARTGITFTAHGQDATWLSQSIMLLYIFPIMPIGRGRTRRTWLSAKSVARLILLRCATKLSTSFFLFAAAATTEPGSTEPRSGHGP